MGVICFDLLALMFHYIERIKSGGKTNVSWFTVAIVLVKIVLLGIMCYYSTLVKDNHITNVLSKPEKSVFDVNISMSDVKKEDSDIMESDFDDALDLSEVETKITNISDSTVSNDEISHSKIEESEQNKTTDGG